MPSPCKDYALRADLAQFKAYNVPSAQGMIKLDAMENPFMLPVHIQNVLGQQLSEVPVNRYPGADLTGVKLGLRALMKPPENVDILVGNGSDEILQLVIMAVARSGATVMGVEPSFVMYRLISQWLGVNYVGVPLKSDFSLDYDAVIEAIKVHHPRLLFLAYPNNPTGNCFNATAIESIIQAAPGLVVIDEAYYAFTDNSFLPVVMQYENVIVVRTVSKLGMAGLRLGCAFGASEWIQPLEGLRLPYNINSFTQVAFKVLMEYSDVFIEQTQCIRKEREALYQQLNTLPFVQAIWPSECNFLLMRVADAPKIFQELKARNILVKLLHGVHPLLEHVLRVSIGTSAENQKFLAALQAIFLYCL